MKVASTIIALAFSGTALAQMHGHGAGAPRGSGPASMPGTRRSSGNAAEMEKEHTPIGQPGAVLANGEVREIRRDSGRISLSHGAVPSMGLPAMTMVLSCTRSGDARPTERRRQGEVRRRKVRRCPHADASRAGELALRPSASRTHTSPVLVTAFSGCTSRRRGHDSVILRHLPEESNALHAPAFPSLPIVEGGRIVAVVWNRDLTHWMVKDEIGEARELVDLAARSRAPL